MKITKAVIPAAGFGTRFLPQTKAMPKEMLPIVDKPVIQYVVEDAISGGIEDIIIVTNSIKRSIEDHFDYPSEDLKKNLLDGGKEQILANIEKIGDMANFVYVRQKGPYGNATPIKCSRHLIQNDPFLVLWGDEFVLSTPSRSQQMMAAFDKYQTTILCGIITNKPEDTKKYGYVQGKNLGNGVWKVDRLIEKPGPENAPSNLAIISGYILTPDIFPLLDQQKPGTGGEYYLPEAIDILAQNSNVYAIELEYEKYFDTGNKLEYMKTVVEMAIRNEEIGDAFKEYLKSVI
ncbi:MAG: UTP--glucose-1-phosphate uridylyltransferase [bacterium]